MYLVEPASARGMAKEKCPNGTGTKLYWAEDSGALVIVVVVEVVEV